MNEKVLELIKIYTDKQNSFFDSNNVESEITNFLTNKTSTINDLLDLKKDILNLIDDDDELFKLYLKIGISLSIEDYKLSEQYKNEIIDYGKKNK